MSLFDTLLIGHFIGDWLLQTEWQAQEKRRNWRAMWSHVAVYHGLVLALLLLNIPGRRPEILAAVALLSLSHAWLDREWPVIGLMRALRMVGTRPPEPWLVRTTDQILHVTLLALAAVYFTRPGPF